MLTRAEFWVEGRDSETQAGECHSCQDIPFLEGLA